MSMASQRFISACGVLPCEDVPERAALAASSVATRIRPLRPLIWGRQRFYFAVGITARGLAHAGTVAGKGTHDTTNIPTT
jgi:hypothetical protein